MWNMTTHSSSYWICTSIFPCMLSWREQAFFFPSCILFAVRNDIRPFCAYTHVTWDVIVTVHISGCFQASYGGANIKYFIDGVSWHILCEVSTEIHELESRVFTYICMYTAFRVGVQTPPTWCFSTLSLLPASTRHVDSSRPSVRPSIR